MHETHRLMFVFLKSLMNVLRSHVSGKVHLVNDIPTSFFQMAVYTETIVHTAYCICLCSVRVHRFIQ